MRASANPRRDPLVKMWLNAVFLMILAMTLIGGITRLTGSGLSMVEWHPLMGALPPMGEAAWREVFTRYQASPQYAEVNTWMTLLDFKRIFFWEYLHRLFGRTIGLVVTGPWLVFLALRRLDRPLALNTLVMILLGGSQGLLGWYMVKSGLVDVPHVSHLRLAAHLSLAFLVAQFVLWVRLGLDPVDEGTPAATLGLRGAIAGAWGLTLVQIVWGAFMAGTRAGWISSTFPDMNGSYLPGVWMDPAQGWLGSAVFVPGMIHWTHRLLGWLVLGALCGVGAWAWRHGGVLRRPALVVGGLVVTQFLLGMTTVMLSVPTAVAVTHQGVALLVLSSLTWLGHRAWGSRGG